MSCVMFFFVFGELRWVIVRFVDIGGIVDHRCLNIFHMCKCIYFDIIDGLYLLQHYSDFKMELRDKPDLNVSEYCEKHDTNKFIGWCSSHDIGVCTLCKKMDHAECSGMESLTELRNVFELSAEFKSLKSKFSKIKTMYRSLQEERRSNIESLQFQKMQIREKIHN